MPVTVELQVDEATLAVLRQDPHSFVMELRMAGAAKLYELGRISQERAAEIAGVGRRDFIFALREYGVSPLQTTMDELKAELDRG